MCWLRILLVYLRQLKQYISQIIKINLRMCHLGDCSVFANKIISKVFSARRPHLFSGVAVVLTTNKTFYRNVYHCKTFEAIFY